MIHACRALVARGLHAAPLTWSAGGAARSEATRWRAPQTPSCRPGARQRPASRTRSRRPLSVPTPQLQSTEKQPSQPASAAVAATSRARRAQSVAVAPAPPTAAGRATSPRSPPPARDAWAGTFLRPLGRRCPWHARQVAGPADTQRRSKMTGGVPPGGGAGGCGGEGGPRAASLAFRPASWPRRGVSLSLPARRPCPFRRFRLYPN